MRAEREIARIQQLKRHWRDADETDSNFRQPAEGRLSSHFGLRRFFNGEARAPHNGLDLAVPRGTPVAASAAGSVLGIDDYFFNGKTVFVDHGNGLITMVCHLDRIDVQVGEIVRSGQRLGLSGMTGRASGPHVHWSVVLNGVMVDPARVPGHHTVFVSGNDQHAKGKVMDLLRALGWSSIIDLGDITSARAAEQLLPLWVRLFSALGNTPDFNIAVMKR